MNWKSTALTAQGPLARIRNAASNVMGLIVTLSLLCATLLGASVLADDAGNATSPRKSAAEDQRPQSQSGGQPKTLGALPSAIPLKPAAGRFGFRSKFVAKDGVFGEEVNEVQLGSPADRMKLLPGDVILAVNGIRLTTPISWQAAMDRMAQRDGWVTLKVRCRDTGIIAYRTTNLLRPRDR